MHTIPVDMFGAQGKKEQCTDGMDVDIDTVVELLTSPNIVILTFDFAESLVVESASSTKKAPIRSNSAY